MCSPDWKRAAIMTFALKATYLTNPALLYNSQMETSWAPSNCNKIHLPVPLKLIKWDFILTKPQKIKLSERKQNKRHILSCKKFILAHLIHIKSSESQFSESLSCCLLLQLVVVAHVSSGFGLLCLLLNQEDETEPDAQAECPPLPYLAFTAHLVALAEALLLGVAQGVPGHDVITQGHMHAPAGLSLACKRMRHNKIKHAREQ